MYSLKDASQLTSLCSGSGFVSVGNREGFVKVCSPKQLYNARTMDQMLRIRPHKARVLKTEIHFGRLFSVAQDHVFTDFDLTRSEKRYSLDTKKGLLDMSINYEENLAAFLRLNGSVDFYSIHDYQKQLWGIDLSDRQNSDLTCFAWSKPNQLVIGIEDGSLLLFDTRNLRKPLTESKIESRPNRLKLLNNGKILVLSDRLDFLDSYLINEESVSVDDGGSSLSTVTEDIERNSIVVAGFDQKLHFIKLKNQL